MARRLRDKSGNVVAVELTAAEMAKTLEISIEDLQEWSNAIPVYAQAHGQPIYRVHNTKDLNRLKKRAALLSTRMSEAAVASVEEADLLEPYANLAEDCPQGLTAHVWRSYAVVVLMQVRYGKMIDAQELAERAGLTEIDPETGVAHPSTALAEKHLRLLQSVDGGYLKVGNGQWEGQWEHRGLPKSWRGI
jgi:hypothetical protein